MSPTFGRLPDAARWILTEFGLLIFMAGVGLRAGADAEIGVVTFIQRFGSALNLNIPLHLQVLDGACTFAAGTPRFHPARAPTD